MNVGIIDADLIGAKKHRFPNLASMKISAYNKNLGNEVKLITSYDEDFSQYDDIYLSKMRGYLMRRSRSAINAAR